MSRIAILGNIAGGKSTLARRMSQARNLPHIEIDALYWRGDWTKVPAQAYTTAHAAAIAQDEWIIDGGGDTASIESRVARATELVLLDLPVWIHFWRAAERQMAWADGTLDHPPGGCAKMPPTKRLFETLWELDQDWMPALRETCDAQEALGKRVIRLRTPEEIEAFSVKLTQRAE